MTEGRSSRLNAGLAWLAVLLTVAVAVQSYFLYKLYQRGDREQAIPETRRGDRLVRGSPARPVPQPFRPAPALSDPDDWFDANPDAWDPFAEMARVRERMNRMFDDSFRRFHGRPGFMDPWDELSFAPEMDLADDGTNYVVRFDVPGVNKADINVNVDGRILTVSGRSGEQKEEKDGQRVVRTERWSGQFQRSLTLPGPVDELNMKAEYQNGVLTVTVPKKTAAQSSKRVMVL